MLTDFQNLFTIVFSMKCATKLMSYFSSHFKDVTPLPFKTKDQNWQNSAACNTILFFSIHKINMIGTIKYALYGVKLSAQHFIFSHIDDTMLKTMPDINHMLLQFIDVMNWQTCCCISPHLCHQ